MPIIDLKPRKILVRSTNWIGDAIMTTPAVRTIRVNFPDAHIAVLVQPWVADVFAASPHVNELIIYDKKGAHQGLAGMYRLGRELAAAHFDMAILLQNAFEAALLARLAGIPVRCGYSRDARRLLLTHPVKLPRERKIRHHVHYYQELLADLGLNPGSDELFLRLPPAAEAWAADFVKSLGDRPLVGINPGAAFGPAKRWPAERYGQVGQRLAQEFGARLVVFGTAADRQAAAAIKAMAPEATEDLTGRTSLAQAMALIGRCNCFVTNDSGLMHVGAALKTPLVALFGSTNAVATGPFSDNSVVVRHELPCSPCLKTHCKTDFRCMLDISVDDVLAPARRLLSGRRD